MPHTRHVMPELNSGTMADIAFLLLIFFMVTTEINEYKGLSLILPLEQPHTPVLKNERNMFTISINSQDHLLVEGKELQSLKGVRKDIKKFIFNYSRDPNLSDSPAEAVVSIKTDRGTSYSAFISALDEAQAAYFEIYSERIGVTPDQFRNLNLNIQKEREIYQKARQGIPMNISIAESK